MRLQQPPEGSDSFVVGTEGPSGNEGVVTNPHEVSTIGVFVVPKVPIMLTSARRGRRKTTHPKIGFDSDHHCSI